MAITPVNAVAEKKGPYVLACNLEAINSAHRPRYHQLLQRVRSAIREYTELANGYDFTLDSSIIPHAEVTEWMDMERLCCPFLTLLLCGNNQQQKSLVLRLTGPEGVKALLDTVFPR